MDLSGRNVPENDDEAVENVEADADVSTEAVGDHLQQHFDGEKTAEKYVAVLENMSQRLRLQPDTLQSAAITHKDVSK